MKDKYIHELELGKKDFKIRLKNNLMIAPMAGITDMAYRNLQYEISDIALVFNEMVSAKALSYNDEKTWKMLEPFYDEDKRIRGIQLFGNEPKDFEEAIKKIKESKLKIDIIDINAGCPAPKVTKNGSGCFLLKDLEKLKKIAESCRSSWDKILSFKIRIGINEKNINALEVCKILEDANIDYITVHGRTYEGMFDAPINFNIIKKIKENSNIPIIFNGGIFTVSDAVNAIKKTNADGIMLARGANFNPFLAKNILNLKEEKIDKEELISIIEMHFKFNIKYIGEERGSKEFRKNLIWYSKFFKNSNFLRSKVCELKNEESFKFFLNELKKLEIKNGEEK